MRSSMRQHGVDPKSYRYSKNSNYTSYVNLYNLPNLAKTLANIYEHLKDTYLSLLPLILPLLGARTTSRSRPHPEGLTSNGGEWRPEEAGERIVRERTIGKDDERIKHVDNEEERERTKQERKSGREEERKVATIVKIFNMFLYLSLIHI